MSSAIEEATKRIEKLPATAHKSQVLAILHEYKVKKCAFCQTALNWDYQRKYKLNGRSVCSPQCHTDLKKREAVVGLLQ